MNVNHLALVTAITIIAATAAYNPANADEILMSCRDTVEGTTTLKMCKVLTKLKPSNATSTYAVADASTTAADSSADMTPPKDLSGAELAMWNKIASTKFVADAPPLMQGAQIPEAPSKDVTKAQVDTQPLDVGADLTPHKDLTGTDLMVWNKFCKGQDPTKVFEWRYSRCSGLDATFKR